MSSKLSDSPENLDSLTVSSFGDEWSRFDQSGLSKEEAEAIFEQYFSILPWNQVGLQSVGFDMGCGSGRWARLVAPRVRKLHCVEPSAALKVAKANLRGIDNVVFHSASLDAVDLQADSQDFGYSLGVLHHIPDTARAIRRCTHFLKPGAPLLLYLYYAFDSRPFTYGILWRLSDAVRRIVHRLPSKPSRIHPIPELASQIG